MKRQPNRIAFFAAALCICIAHLVALTAFIGDDFPTGSQPARATPYQANGQTSAPEPPMVGVVIRRAQR